jgi:D-alanine-D-alanine ligase-like ATP-grasp enzyme
VRTYAVLHGPNCEDGTIQGAIELANVAYVGSRVAASAVAMDKDLAKRLLRDAGLPVVPFISATAQSPIGYAESVAVLKIEPPQDYGTMRDFVVVDPTGVLWRIGQNIAASGETARADQPLG